MFVSSCFNFFYSCFVYLHFFLNYALRPTSYSNSRGGGDGKTENNVVVVEEEATIAIGSTWFAIVDLIS